MTMQDEQTPIDRPLPRSDINDIRIIVHRIDDRSLEFVEGMKALTRRVEVIETDMARSQRYLERHLWFPALVSVVAAAVAVLARIAP